MNKNFDATPQEANGEPSAELRSMPAPAPPAPYPITTLSFTYAKTMPDCPHEYAVKRPDNEQEFIRMQNMVKEHGVWQRWRGRRRRYKGTRR